MAEISTAGYEQAGRRLRVPSVGNAGPGQGRGRWWVDSRGRGSAGLRFQSAVGSAASAQGPRLRRPGGYFELGSRLKGWLCGFGMRDPVSLVKET